MTSPRILDVFCGSGGASMGYSRAGFEPYGIDNDPKPLRHYPFPYVCMDALEAMDRLLKGEGLTFSNGETLYLADFDACHASPPCQAYSRLRHLSWLKGKNYPALIGIVRQLLVASNKPWVIENVADAPLGQEYGYIMLCGWSLAEMPLYRHRLFESNIALLAPAHRPHPEIFYPGGKLGSRYSQANTVCGAFGYTKKVSRSYGTFVSVVGHDGTRNFPKAKEAMGIDWMTGNELSQAIPPCYTCFIGKYLLSALHGGGHPLDYSLHEHKCDTCGVRHLNSQIPQKNDLADNECDVSGVQPKYQENAEYFQSGLPLQDDLDLRIRECDRYGL